MKNYYELLEVSEKASPEVIKKAYTTLVKKYHPDLQPDNEKKSAEDKIKDINEAYEVLSDSVKRNEYDRKLEVARRKEEQAKYSHFNNTYQNNHNNYSQNSAYNADLNQKNKPQKRVIRKPNIHNNYDDFSDFNNFQKDYNTIMNEVYNNAYNQAYINSLKNIGYEIHYERPFKEKIKIAFITFCVIIVFSIICFILWHIPVIKNYFIDLYNNNFIIKFIFDFISAIIRSFLALFKK